MANEVTISLSLNYADSEGADETLQLTDVTDNASVKKYLKAKQNVGTSEEALVLGEVTSPLYALIINRDVTNFVTVKVGTGGAVFAKLRPGRGCLVPLGSGAQAPFLQADTAACQVEYLVVSA